jgi:hypothetical protein
MRILLIFIFTFVSFSQTSLGKENKKRSKKSKSIQSKTRGKLVASGAKKSRYKILRITFQEGETLGKLISLFVKKNSIISRREPMVQRTLKRNKHIKDWRKIKAGEKIYLYLDKKFLDESKFNDYVSKKKKDKKKKKKKKIEILKHHISFQYGIVDIKKESDGLSLSFAKFGYKYANRWKEKYSYSASIKMTRFLNFEYSEGTSPVSPDGFYNEFTFNIGRVKPFWKIINLSVQYDMLNYFVVGSETVDDVTFTPLLVHRVSMSGFYPHTKKLGFFLSTGILKSIGETDITGGDFSTGSKFNFGEKLKYSVSGAVYGSSLTTSTSSESSIAISVTGGMGF